jgi:hypothetical protein
MMELKGVSVYPYSLSPLPQLILRKETRSVEPGPGEARSRAIVHAQGKRVTAVNIRIISRYGRRADAKERSSVTCGQTLRYVE